MSKSVFEQPHFTNPEAARALVEAELWPHGPVCNHCREKERRYETKRPGRYRCGNPKCRKDYTVTTGTVMESSHVPLNKWLLAFHLAASSKKGFSAHQLHRTLKITYKSAWFLFHRVREAMRTGGLDPLGGEGKIVEADETYMGKRDGKRSEPDTFVSGHGWHSYPRIQTQRKILSLVERGGAVRSFHVDRVTLGTVKTILHENIARETELMTDEAPFYELPGWRFKDHHTVKHSAKEYVRGYAHTNTIEGYFSIFKRGMKGVYQHCSSKHLHRYLAEFDFHYSHRAALGYNDEMRAALALKGASGKRLTYQQSNRA